MRDLALQCAGVVAIVVALIHGVLSETKVFVHATIEPVWARRLVRPVWHCSTVAWIGSGILLIAAPQLASEPARHLIVATAVANFAYAAVANALATRFRHFGWMLLSIVTALAVAGY